VLGAQSDRIVSTEHWIGTLRGDLERVGAQVGALGEAVATARARQDHDEATTAAALAALERTLGELQAMQQDVAAQLGAHRGEVGALADRLEQRMRDAERRVEFVRQEALFEVRAITQAAPRASAGVAQAEILDREKYDAFRARGDVRINVGCGHNLEHDYLNVDARRIPGIDVLAEAAGLPFEPESVDEIYSSHVLEHFPVESLRRVVLPHWLGVLKPGGLLRAIVPDAEAMLREYAAGAFSFDDLREVTFGLQEYDGDFHFGMFSRDGLRALLTETGLVDVAYAFVDRRNGKCFDMEVRARKPAPDQPSVSM
jgi:SAM-dependent methyltransferase